ncbi:poly-beta-1,6-N-acetyl-D-glucosamine biosynthesis protein PgaD [Bordetella bronchiseptica 99-R-0433]|uniref:poly-beta-1,6-N-acetyl-D-glucosamine biosynthesis protein PgaD n=1 Tax=Bordetella bronchiseptica TaxID=518 RepID=UPI000459DCC8|nr:poly-beta-1,6-N-acetyl-D-glucosamine biosynthesis protein PgaD [Bordetella bronchiseptica]KCV59270.1 poly-beta-1,6-N-acetyl-D-glucosamine biosynthesis protein PgaD [Bordetella bronchiseptica 99-R-0433]
MIIKTPRSRVAAAIDALLTALAWFGFFYLFGAGLLAVLQGARGGPEIGWAARVLPSLATLGAYLAVALLNAAVLVAWARYNAMRYGGLDRRRVPDPLGDRDLARSFGVDRAQRARIAGAKSLTVHHTEDGRIRALDFERLGYAAA